MTSHFQHPDARVESNTIGRGTRVWAFAHILPNAVIGADCNVCDGVFIENDVIVGDRVTIKCGVQLWDGLRVEDDVFIGPNATFTNDPFPRSGKHPPEYARTVIRKGASIGANATILPGITIGVGAMVGAGSVVTQTVPPNAIVRGNPARITGYVDTTDAPAVRDPALSATVRELKTRGAKLYEMPLVRDARGSLTFGEIDTHLPFAPQRYFLIVDVPNSKVRGEHAHKQLQEFLVCVHGSCSVVVDDGTTRDEVVLDRPTIGLYIGPMVWSVQYKYSPDAVLMVLASDPYEADDYIRDYDDFMRAIEPAKGGNS